MRTYCTFVIFLFKLFAYPANLSTTTKSHQAVVNSLIFSSFTFTRLRRCVAFYKQSLLFHKMVNAILQAL